MHLRNLSFIKSFIKGLRDLLFIKSFIKGLRDLSFIKSWGLGEFMGGHLKNICLLGGVKGKKIGKV